MTHRIVMYSPKGTFVWNKEHNRFVPCIISVNLLKLRKVAAKAKATQVAANG